jgi:cation diffusion facilitator CzcD-associated flavoprotein CzcO
MSVLLDVTRTPGAQALEDYDAVVIGAGPYGLSTAAHLRASGLRVAVFGKPVELWRRHMPRGMRLRSHAWATDLADPAGRHGFERFLRAAGHSTSYPVPIEAFIDYALWFTARAVGGVDETYVASVERGDGGFHVSLVDGRRLRARAVVMAIGLAYYVHRPLPYAALPAELVSHSGEHRDLGRFTGRRVVVIGGGQSAVEFTALLHEAGARAHLVARRPIDWLGRDRIDERSIVERIVAPRAGIAPGWINLALERMPYLFYRLPQAIKDTRMRPYYAATASHWLKDRVSGKARVHEGRAVAGLDPAGGGVRVTLSDAQRIDADHVILATGYKVDLTRLTMLHPSLLRQISTQAAIPGVSTAGSGCAPALSPWFESSVPGLYFVGATSMRAFGPLYRFVVGCKPAAARVAAAIARRRRGAPA